MVQCEIFQLYRLEIILLTYLLTYLKSWLYVAHKLWYVYCTVCTNVLWKQPSFQQTSETVSGKYWITQIIAQWVPGSWASNSKCPTPIRAQTVSRHRAGVIMPVCSCHWDVQCEYGCVITHGVVSESPEANLVAWFLTSFIVSSIWMMLAYHDTRRHRKIQHRPQTVRNKLATTTLIQCSSKGHRITKENGGVAYR